MKKKTGSEGAVCVLDARVYVTQSTGGYAHCRESLKRFSHVPCLALPSAIEGDLLSHIVHVVSATLVHASSQKHEPL